MINVFRTPDKNGRDSIAVLLSQDAMLVTQEGDPFPGVALYVPQAREIACRLLLFVKRSRTGGQSAFMRKIHPGALNPMPVKIATAPD
jgi:hypothetical protein